VRRNSFSATCFVELQAAKRIKRKKKRESFFIKFAKLFVSKIVFFHGIFSIRIN
jgi:hypothetical protein